MVEPNVIDLADRVDKASREERKKLPTDELVRRLNDLAVEGSDRRQRVFSLAEVAITQLPNDTDADRPLAVLEALRDQLLELSNDAFEMNHLIAALIARVQTTTEAHHHG